MPSAPSMDTILGLRLWVTSLKMIEGVLGQRAFSVCLGGEVSPSALKYRLETFVLVAVCHKMKEKT
ncbi:hypothetical protein E2C01_057214 [Portunus trituberculatus]|uniref:Uncharacterized protein n=1 Tax=Portunus trituberculatus TaxID=210409 RepID=A0A5B7GSU0_PORTR|nr:hypothetical protein [Portunus trituberculatus]